MQARPSGSLARLQQPTQISQASAAPSTPTPCAVPEHAWQGPKLQRAISDASTAAHEEAGDRQPPCLSRCASEDDSLGGFSPQSSPAAPSPCRARELLLSLETLDEVNERLRGEKDPPGPCRRDRMPAVHEDEGGASWTIVEGRRAAAAALVEEVLYIKKSGLDADAGEGECGEQVYIDAEGPLLGCEEMPGGLKFLHKKRDELDCEGDVLRTPCQGPGSMSELEERPEGFRSPCKRREEGDCGGDVYIDAEGIWLTPCRGSGPLSGSEERLQSVGSSYKRRCGVDSDDAEEGEEGEEDGARWVFLEGSGKLLYREELGLDAATEEAGCGENVHVDAEGALWMMCRGKGPLLDERLKDTGSEHDRMEDNAKWVFVEGSSAQHLAEGALERAASVPPEDESRRPECGLEPVALSETCSSSSCSCSGESSEVVEEQPGSLPDQVALSETCSSSSCSDSEEPSEVVGDRPDSLPDQVALSETCFPSPRSCSEDASEVVEEVNEELLDSLDLTGVARHIVQSLAEAALEGAAPTASGEADPMPESDLQPGALSESCPASLGEGSDVSSEGGEEPAEWTTRFQAADQLS